MSPSTDAVAVAVADDRLQQFSKYMHSGYLLQVPVFRDFYDGPTFPTFIQQLSLKPTYIDTVAVFTPAADGKPAIIRVSVLNRHPTSDWEAHFRFDDFSRSSSSCPLYLTDILRSHGKSLCDRDVRGRHDQKCE